MPSIREYAQKYETSSSTIQRALKELERNGYIETAAGKGATVSFLQGKVSPDSPTWKVFWSYAQKDDELERGRITELKEDIQAEYQVQTGDELNIFQDREGIEWGMDWRKAIQENLGVTTFFIPILTPTYLRRPNCLGELKAAIQQFGELGVVDGIYPIEYIDISRQLKLLEDDEVANYLEERQRVRDWRELRFEDRGSSAYRRGVRDIVAVLIEKDERMSNAFEKLQAQKSTIQIESGLDEGPGLIDRISELEEYSQELAECMGDISETINEIGDVFKVEKVPNTMSPKEAIILIGKISHRLKPSSERLREQGSHYREIIKKVDESVSASIELLGLLGSMDEAEKMLKSVEEIKSNASAAFSQINSISGALMKGEAMSRQLREPSRAIRAALEDVVASQYFFDRWEVELKEVLGSSDTCC